MTPEVLFYAANGVVIPGWALLLFAPNGRWTHRLVHWGVLPLALCAAYSLLLMLFFRAPLTAFATMNGVQALFQDRFLLLAGWIHYLAFDLWVGAWMTRKARTLGMPRWQSIPSVLLTYAFGPAGLLLFHALRLTARPQPR